jgi:hypothetical protein
MNPNWAEENLQTIRTLMERSALYRRALAPIMMLAGYLGIFMAAAGLAFHIDWYFSFYFVWIGAAALAVLGSLFLARRQALKDKEVFWSPPTRRVVQALTPPLLAGFALGTLPLLFKVGLPNCALLTAMVWMLFYGCALHAAGFFMPRSVKYMGWLFIIASCGGFYGVCAGWLAHVNAHWLMGFSFGGLQLVYGVLLHFTEKKTPVA